MMNATHKGAQFLYPKSRQFPFDEICEQIVRALEGRNWTVPGINVDFDVYGTGEEKYRLVRYIKGHDFMLRFGRPQGRLGTWNDTAAVTELVIPMKELHVYEDESGPSLYAYVGESWEQDKLGFMNGSKLNSKLNGAPRTYLAYKGGCDCRGAMYLHSHSGMRAPHLIHDNDLNREYDPNENEPRVYRTEEIFLEFTQWLKDNLLAKILAHPEQEEKTDFFSEKTTPLPSGIGPIFCFGDEEAARRVLVGKQDISELEPRNRYGFIGSGYRLLSLGISSEGTVPDAAYDGFKWCGLGEVTEETPFDTLIVPGHYSWSDMERYVFRVSPSSADGIYIADNAPFEKRRSELFLAIKPRTRLTDAELNQALRARARTIIPITDYAGDYEEPVVLINRELALDEVELVSGPWERRS